MAASEQPKFGVTHPLSEALPTDAEIKASTALVEELKRQNNYESNEETIKRKEVLASIQKIAEEFVRIVGRSQKLTEQVAKAGGALVCTYGSYRLGVYGPGSDIDTLIIGPRNVKHVDFFKYFPDLLLKHAPEGAITDLSAVSDAYVPIIKFEWSGISIDLIYASIDQDQIKKELSLLGMNILQGLNEVEMRSLNGTRVTDEILSLVPEQGVFRTALRGIKLWAQRRAIYANIMGFPGGVAWAMMLARVCQLYPKATASVMIFKFFKVMEKWNWPQPVLLKNIEQNPNMKARIWNPNFGTDRFHLMPIITPSYPSMCATHNISNSTKQVILNELKRGGDIVESIMSGKLPWKDLFAKHTFFTQGYKYYLSVISSSTTKEAQLKWSGMVESKVRILVVGVEGHQSIKLAHPFNKGFERAHRCRVDDDIEKVKTGSLEFQAKDIPTGTTGHGPVTDSVAKEETNDGTKPDEEGATMVYTTTHYVGLELNDGAKSLDLSYQVDEFKRLCFGWDHYDKELNALHVVHTRNFDLPDDVFGEGETKPSRPPKKKKRTADEANSTASKRRQTSVAAAG